jgi:putative NADPH-quinone reductase
MCVGLQTKSPTDVLIFSFPYLFINLPPFLNRFFDFFDVTTNLVVNPGWNITLPAFANP